MIYLDVTKKTEKTVEDDKERKTLIMAEVDNGYIVIKRVEKKGEEGYITEEGKEEKVMVFKENPLEEKKDESSEMGDMLTKITENLMG